MNYLLWMTKFVCSEGEIDKYARLFEALHSFVFVPVMAHDQDRIGDAEEMRREFLSEGNTQEFPLSPSVLEVMIALARRLDSIIGYDTSSPRRWFWHMIYSLGLIKFTDENFDENAIVTIVSAFLAREYSPNGRGSLCYYPCERDLRDVDIWYQWMYYLGSLKEFQED